MAEIITLERYDRLASNCYILIDNGTGAVIDPSVPYDQALARLGGRAVKIKYVILTHGHADHFWEIDSYVRAGAEVLVPESDACLLSDPWQNCSFYIGYSMVFDGAYRTVSDTDTVMVGNTALRVMNTPGHTVGSVAYYTDELAFVGDTIFDRGGYGRTDLPSGDQRLLEGSINAILTLPESLTVYAGHGAPFTIKSAKTYFQKRIF